MKKSLYAAFGSVVLALFAIFVVSSQTTQASNSKNSVVYETKTDDGRIIEVTYVASTKKLGILVKDKAGNNIAGYILKDVTSLEKEFDLSNARKFGDDTSLGNVFKINKIKEENASITIADGQTLNFGQLAVSNAGRQFGECNSACTGPSSTWGTCFYCCVWSSDC